MLDAYTFILAMGHDVQERLQRRASALDAAVFEVAHGDSRLGLDDRVDTGNEARLILQLGAQHVRCEYGIWGLKDPRQKVLHEARRDAISEPAGQDGAPV